MTAPTTQIRPATRQCKRKQRYDTELDARIAVRENHGNHPDFTVYLCPHCWFWHTGHDIREVA